MRRCEDSLARFRQHGRGTEAESTRLGSERDAATRSPPALDERSWTGSWSSPRLVARAACSTEKTVMTSLPLSRDAATVVAFAGSALPFAGSADEEVERWLRPLRLFGEAGAVLQGMGIGEAPLSGPANKLELDGAHRPDESVAAVLAHAEDFARQRDAAYIRTSDLLVAVMGCYPRAFAR